MTPLIFSVLLGCNAGSKPVPNIPAASTPTPEAEQMILTLNPDELQYDDDAGTATFSPGSSVRSAQYTHYILDLASLEAALGGRPSAPVAVVVELTDASERVYSPSDPGVQQPQGGFHITEHTGRVVSRAP